MKSKVTLVLVLLFLFGIPAIVVTGLLFGSVTPVFASDQDQPGGHVSGKVVDADGNPLAGISVEIGAASESGAVHELDVIVTSADGSFEATLPAHRGFYDISAGGGVWRRSGTSFSFLDREGELRTPRPVELELEPGCDLTIEIVEADGSPAGDGSYDLSGEYQSGMLFGLAKGFGFSSRLTAAS